MILTADGNEEVFSKNRSLIGRVEIMVHKQCGTGTPRAFLKRGKWEVEKLEQGRVTVVPNYGLKGNLLVNWLRCM